LLVLWSLRDALESPAIVLTQPFGAPRVRVGGSNLRFRGLHGLHGLHGLGLGPHGCNGKKSCNPNV
jgi:hypothetical protein